METQLFRPCFFFFFCIYTQYECQVKHTWICLVFAVSDFPQERCPVVLAPLLYPEKRDILMDRILPDSGELAKTMMESSLAEFMQEVGYGFCAR